MSAIDFDKIDSQILQIVNLLIEQLQIRDFKPSRVSWEGYVIGGLGTYTGPRVRLAPPGLCLFTWDEVMLTGGLKGRLEPEEWRPLLASSLIYEAKLKPKK